MEARPRNEPRKWVQDMFQKNQFKERSTKKGSRYGPQKPIQGTIHKDVQGTTQVRLG
jgi:hypothetical protein